MRDKRHTEYGGGPGSPQRREDGSSIPLSPAERRRIVAMQMKRDLPSSTEPRIQTTSNGAGVISEKPFEPDVRALKELDEKTNGYSKEFGNGPTGTGETVG